jgi:phi13 family phage major tail protein
MPQEAVRAFGDNRTAEIAVASGNISVTGAFHTVPNEDKEKLFGLETSNGLTAFGAEDNPPYVAAIFSKTFEDGSREWVGLAKGIFMRPTMTGATKTDGVEFSSEEVTAEFMDRDITGFTETKSVVFGRDLPGATTQRDALFTAIFGAPHPDAVV